MKKPLKIFIVAISASLIIIGCGDNSKKPENPQNSTENEKKPDSNKVYSLTEALAGDFIKISADGNGTFRNIRVNIENNSNSKINVSLPAGIYFENPDDKAQSLITAKKRDEILLNDKEKISVDVRSFCTNVNQKVPGVLKDWKYNPNYKGGLDEVIEFYGQYEKGINEWLEKKNPKFSSDENRMLFFQIVIWYHEGGKYQEILNMLKKDVFQNDINHAKIWLDEIHAEAAELAQLIKERDSDKIKNWLKQKVLELIPTTEQIDNVVEKGKKKLEGLRNRLKNN